MLPFDAGQSEVSLYTSWLRLNKKQRNVQGGGGGGSNGPPPQPI